MTKDGYTYTEIRRVMYGLPAAGILAQKLLKKRLNKEGYSQSKTTPGFWTHKWRPVSFTLCIDDFGVNYVGIEHANNLISVLQESYKISTNWEGKCYLELDLDWDYKKREVHLLMLSYVSDALKRFNQNAQRKPQDQPFTHVKPNYGAKAQY